MRTVSRVGNNSAALEPALMSMAFVQMKLKLKPSLVLSHLTMLPVTYMIHNLGKCSTVLNYVTIKV